jgi:hypothetical protein
VTLADYLPFIVMCASDAKGQSMDKKYVIGAAVAVGALVLVPGLAAALARAGEPLKKAAVRSGAVAWDEFRKAAAEAYEHMEDLAAEVRAEVETRQAEEAAAQASAAASATGQDGA